MDYIKGKYYLLLISDTLIKDSAIRKLFEDNV